jgi:hypothetical protein
VLGGIGRRSRSLIGTNAALLASDRWARSCPPTGSGGEADAQLLADLAVVVGDHVGGIGVYAGHAQYIDVDAGLFEGFADGCLGWCLADLKRASGRPSRVIPAPR